MKIYILLPLLLLFSYTISAQSVSLFNGKDLTGWKINGTEKWYVDKGEMVCESGPDKQYGYLSTTQNYKNFISVYLRFPRAVSDFRGQTRSCGIHERCDR